jgi:hypothetical protein
MTTRNTLYPTSRYPRPNPQRATMMTITPHLMTLNRLDPGVRMILMTTEKMSLRPICPSPSNMAPAVNMIVLMTMIESVDDSASDQNSSTDGELSFTEELDDLSSVVLTESHKNVNERPSENELLGRGMQTRQPKTCYYTNEDFQFLQTSFQDLLQDTREDFLSYAMDEFQTSQKNPLLGRYLTAGVVGLRKHGKEAEKTLLKEFQRMDVMLHVLESDLLSDKQKEEALGMVNILQEKRDHMPQNPHLKIQGCANGKKQWKLYMREETSSPTTSGVGLDDCHHGRERRCNCGCSRCISSR